LAPHPIISSPQTKTSNIGTRARNTNLVVA
jgi:hypothetical protein